MSSPLRVTHAHGDRITVTEERGGIDLISHVYRAEAGGEPVPDPEVDTEQSGEPVPDPEVLVVGDCAEVRWTTPQGRRLTLRGGRSVVSREEHAALHSATLDGAAPPSPRLSESRLVP
ncbi:hypothetical protein ACIBBE_33200 [Streptomyces sp. NPDC051644]|uniref:hypothetical protein n=1 Tax=Streptomyces sp. NPDC051644 TaxID=3365666 RepID=UPI0037BA94F9